MAAAEGCGGRDDAVDEAAVAGLGIARIEKIGGLGTATMMRILNSHPGRVAGRNLTSRLPQIRA
jgi:hypothetical protein